MKATFAPITNHNLYQWRFFALACFLFLLAFWQRLFVAHDATPTSTLSASSAKFSKVASILKSEGLQAQATESTSIEEAGIALPSFVGPFTCDIGDLPKQVRMTSWMPEKLVVLGHGTPDSVTDFMWAGQGWETSQLTQMTSYSTAIQTIDPSRDGYIDIGVNIGAHLLFFAARNFHVHGFEPTFANYILVKCSLAYSAIASRTRFNAFGLGETPAEVCMKSSPGNFGDSRVQNTTDCPLRSKAYIGTMNHYHHTVLAGRQKIGVMKMDIQGFEVGAMRAATQLFASDEAPVVVFFEYDVSMNKEHGYDAQELATFFHERDYDLYRVPNTTAIPVEDFALFGKMEGWPQEAEIVALSRKWKGRLEEEGYMLEGAKLVGRRNPGGRG